MGKSVMEGKVAIITGASRGVGEATAMALSRNGVSVVLAARTLNDLERVSDEIQANGGDALVVRTDVTLLDQVQQLVDQTLDHHGKIDVLINNSGIGIFES
nr:SDR family NAD(P)-dependent oxidoreductase [Candidatus Poribacteria bacterium]